MRKFNTRDQRRISGQVVRVAKRRNPALRAAIEALETRRLLTTVVVNTTADNVNDSNVSGPTVTLREAVNSNATDITFAPGVAGKTITLTLGELDLHGFKTIDGGTAGVTISGNHASRVFLAELDSIVTLNNLNITDGFDASGLGGGGVFDEEGILVVNGCALYDNASTSIGGGILEFSSAQTLGTLAVTESTFSGNSAIIGAAIDVAGGQATITACTLAYNISTGNTAGGIYVQGGGNGAGGGTATIKDCIAAQNTGVADIGINPQQGGHATGSYDLIGTGSAGLSTDFNTFTNTLTGEPLLGPVSYYGGPTQTVPLLPTSLGLGAGIAANYPDTLMTGMTTPITTDQRGYTLPLTGQDMGAYQTQTTAVDFLVKTTADPGLLGQQSLRGAVGMANVLGGSPTITLVPAVTGQTITLNQGEMELTAGTGITTIEGGTGGLTVDGDQASRVFQVDSGAAATFNALTITNGNASASAGGGIDSDGTVILTDCTLSSDSASGDGGGIFNGDDGTLTLTNGTLSGDSAAGDGGGIFSDGTLTLTDCTLSGASSTDGSGGGIASGGTLTLTNCTLSGDSAPHFSGGGIESDGSGILTDVTLANDSAATGGGIANLTGALTLIDCTLAGDSALSGGGILNQATLTLADSTVAGDSAVLGGIDNSGSLVLNDSIVAQSLGADIYNNGGTVSGSHDLIGDGSSLSALTNSVSGNPLLGALANYGGLTQTLPLLPGSPAIDAGGDSLIRLLAVSGSSGNMTVTVNGRSAIVAFNVTPGELQLSLDALSSVGGVGGTATVNPIAGGFLIIFGGTLTSVSATAVGSGGATATLTNPAAVDQRGIARPQGSAPDIGAFESQGFDVTLASGNNQSTLVSTPFAHALKVSVTPVDGTDPVAGGIITYTVNPVNGAGAGLLSSTATIQSDGTASDTATANGVAGSYSVTASASGAATPASFSLTNTNQNDVSVSVTDSDGGSSITSVSGTALAGTPITYTIIVTNSGPDAATSVGVSDPAPAGLTSIVWSGGGQTNVSGALSDTIASLSAFASVIYTVTGTIDPSATGTLSNTATVTAANDTNSTNNSATDTVSITPPPQSQAVDDDASIDVSETVIGSSTTVSSATTASGNLLANDQNLNSDPSTITRISDAKNPGGVAPVNGVITIDGAFGTLVVQTTGGQAGDYTYTLDSGATPPVGAADTFAYTLTDASPNSSTANLSVDLNVTVLQSTPSIAIVPYNVVYNGKAHTAKGTATGAGNVDLSADLHLSGTTHTNAGTYSVDTWTFHDPSGTYPDASGIVKDIISKAKPVITVTGATATYDGNPHGATATAAGVESPKPVNLSSLVKLSYRNTSTNIVSTTPPVALGTYQVLVTFSGNTNYAASSNVNSGKTVVISKPAAAFSGLLSPTVSLHQPSTTLSGKVSAGALQVGGMVSITINGVSIQAAIKSGGLFSAAFPTANLAPGAYTVTYAYAGSSTVAASSAVGKLTVTFAIKLLFNNSLAYKKDSTITVKFEADDVNGKAVASTSRTATATAIAKVMTPKLLLPLPAGSSPGGKFTASSDHATFTLTLSTTGLASGQYLLYFTLSGDPVTHAATFIIA